MNAAKYRRGAKVLALLWVAFLCGVAWIVQRCEPAETVTKEVRWIGGERVECLRVIDRFNHRTSFSC